MSSLSVSLRDFFFCSNFLGDSTIRVMSDTTALESLSFVKKKSYVTTT